MGYLLYLIYNYNFVCMYKSLNEITVPVNKNKEKEEKVENTNMLTSLLFITYDCVIISKILKYIIFF